jgi:hypothetical protein
MTKLFRNLFNCLYTPATKVDHTCIICYDAQVENMTKCCKQPICSQCWDMTTLKTNKCPHCRTSIDNKPIILDYHPGSEYERYGMIGDLLTTPLLYIIAANRTQYKDALMFARGYVERHEYRVSVYIYINTRTFIDE